MNSPHCTFFENLLLIVSSTANALPRRLLLLRQDGNHIQKCPFVSRASCVTFSVQQPFHQTRNKKINLSWSAYSIARIVYVVSYQKKKVFDLHFTKVSNILYFLATISSEMNIAHGINNHLRSIDIFRSMII